MLLAKPPWVPPCSQQNQFELYLIYGFSKFTQYSMQITKRLLFLLKAHEIYN